MLIDFEAKSQFPVPVYVPCCLSCLLQTNLASCGDTMLQGAGAITIRGCSVSLAREKKRNENRAAPVGCSFCFFSVGQAAQFAKPNFLQCAGTPASQGGIVKQKTVQG